ncbi:Hpt domain-containing protein [Blastopirellula sp. JC732]|uniref:Hpt domain-containing protein n=1 Tax=Blastopirellula sediminis TaxID=2894196 RepID=A0A9X1SFH5_9BACT|nr:Hpt domain-containing protein [Blastopirellula sediminis]MCC9609476.1 Hpt domain-containing protein [Blastopirellula sediminis]MCC9627747.1 Hpt domain-containing protein [Blastopirellula sediminis]
MPIQSLSEPLYSDLGNDPDLAEIVEMFVDEMPDRIESMLGCVDRSDWEGLGRIAHQLKGAAGSYGFGQITPYAAQLEHDCRHDASEEEMINSFRELAGVCRRIRSGAPQ